jgi:crotonobetaine/carnitine-CoA ligase
VSAEEEQWMSDLDGFLSALDRAVQTTPHRTMARLGEKELSVEALDQQSNAVSALLRDRGVQRGDRVAVMARNNLFTISLIFGISKAGAVWVPINGQLQGPNLKYIFDHCEPGLIIADDEFIRVLADAGVSNLDHRVVSNRVMELEAQQTNAAGAAVSDMPTPADPFCIMYTSGTTGAPKGVIVTHGMFRLCGEAVLMASDASDGDVFFVWEPFHHIGGAQLILLPLLRDIRLAMVDRFSVSQFWLQVREAGATHIHYLGGILQMLLKQEPSAKERDHSARVAWGAGCPASVQKEAAARFGCEVRECYGMTEASSITTCNRSMIEGSVGMPVPWFSISIVDEDDKQLPVGQKGEVIVWPKTPGAITPGYLHNPEATALALRGDGLHSGDLGSIDANGALYFHGRLTDSLRTRGENVSAWDVEHVVLEHPDVDECAIIGVDNELGDQDIKLFVQPKPARTINPHELFNWLEPRLARYQRPRFIESVEQFEKTPSLRIIKYKLPTSTDGCWDRDATSKA